MTSACRPQYHRACALSVTVSCCSWRVWSRQVNDAVLDFELDSITVEAAEPG